jgi:pimeloyl-ACP methyl ester carboxylesterase
LQHHCSGSVDAVRMFLIDDSQHLFLRTVSFGDGPATIVALNGWSAAWEAWQPTFELLGDLRCISYDTRGCGASRCSPESVTLDALVDDVFRVLDAHGVDRCVLAGESLGGYVAMHAVLRDPSRFDALVTVAAPPIVPVGHPLGAAALDDYPRTVAAFVRECFAGDDVGETLHRWGESLFLGADPRVAARLFDACADRVLDLAAISVPTTVVHGTADAVVPVDAGRMLVAAIPGAVWVELAGASHAPTVTRPTEVADVLRAVVVDTHRHSTAPATNR